VLATDKSALAAFLFVSVGASWHFHRARVVRPAGGVWTCWRPDFAANFTANYLPASGDFALAILLRTGPPSRRSSTMARRPAVRRYQVARLVAEHPQVVGSWERGLQAASAWARPRFWSWAKAAGSAASKRR